MEVDMGARADWERRIGRRGVPGQGDGTGGLPAPGELRVAPGRGHVTLSWEPVAGAAGYLVYRASGPGGPFEPLDHGGGDVLAVPAGPYADTSGEAGRVRYYAVAAVADGESAGPLSSAVGAAPGPGVAASGSSVRVDVGSSAVGELARPWEPMIGSEHLSYLLREDRTGGRVTGAELREALRIARDEFGVRAVRAHGILCDDLGVYTESDGRPVHDFTGVDRVYDTLMEAGLRPVVELSFMPAALARDPSKTVFFYEGIISPPRDWSRWADLVRGLAFHLLERYGEDEVTRHWAFEVWNEPNIGVFWSGTPEEYFRLYDTAAVAIKSVHPGLLVGGPASAAAGWVRQLLAHVGSSGAPLDFASTHVYGNVPLDLRPALAAAGREGTPIWWTEWGTTPSHFNRVGDSVFAAAFLLRGMKSVLGRVGALSHWVASDHFEELGPPPELFHGGFGLLSVGNLRKPRYWALLLLARLGPHRLPVDVSGDGALGLVDALAARHDDGRIGVLVWNGTLDQGKVHGDPVLDRSVRVRVSVPVAGSYAVRHYRIDALHSNIVPAWERMSRGAAWPSDDQWQVLREANRLEELMPVERVVAADGVVELAFELPMPGVSYLELTRG
jgi:xylan 1,4-beta-xylosidase